MAHVLVSFIKIDANSPDLIIEKLKKNPVLKTCFGKPKLLIESLVEKKFIIDKKTLEVNPEFTNYLEFETRYLASLTPLSRSFSTSIPSKISTIHSNTFNKIPFLAKSQSMTQKSSSQHLFDSSLVHKKDIEQISGFSKSSNLSRLKEFDYYQQKLLSHPASSLESKNYPEINFNINNPNISNAVNHESYSMPILQKESSYHTRSNSNELILNDMDNESSQSDGDVNYNKDLEEEKTEANPYEVLFKSI